MARLDTAGVYRGEILEHSLDTTKNGYPQFVARLKATEKWIEDPAHFEHFGIEGPTWVDWSQFAEEIVGFFVLFNDRDVFDENTSLLNYEQLQLATGWEGDEFDSLNNDSHVGKTVQFRTEESEYDGKVSLKVEWIDDKDASPNRELRKLDAAEVSYLSKKLKVKKARPSAAKLVTKPATKSKTATPPSKAKPEPEPEPEKEAKAEATPEPKAEADRPGEVPQGEAWAFICDNKGGNSDTEVQDAWIAACEEVGPDKDEDDFTDADWAKVRDIVIRDLSLDV